MTNEQCPPHYWVIDEFNVGHYKKCPAVKDFGALLNKEKNFVEKTRPGASLKSPSASLQL